VVIQGFGRFSASGRKNDNDRAVILDSLETDYLHSRSTRTRIFNAQYDYTFVAYEEIYVWSDGNGNNRATFQQSHDSEVLENDAWSQLVGPNFQTTVFRFEQVRIIDP